MIDAALLVNLVPLHTLEQDLLERPLVPQRDRGTAVLNPRREMLRVQASLELIQRSIVRRAIHRLRGHED